MSLGNDAPIIRKKIGIITGASAGLGREFALQLEKEHFLDELWLIARRTEPMRDLSTRLRKAKGMILGLDLTKPSDMAILEKKLNAENPEIHFLVNNAGYGKIGPFAELGLQEQLQMIDLNVRALTHLTYLAQKFLTPGSCVFQVASSIAYSPAPNFAVYAATKSFVLSLSQALQFEWRAKGIHVIAVCPGPVDTEFFTVAQNNQYTKDHVVPAEPFNKALVAQAKDVVKKALSDAKACKRVSIYGFPIRLFTSLVGLIPKGIVMRVMSKRH